MNNFQEYFQPKSIEEALHDLSGTTGSVAVVAGGTDLLLELRQGRHPAVDRLVDVSGIDSLCQIKMDDEFIYLGAGVTHKDIIRNPLLNEHAQCVVEGCGLIGGPQVRNVATIGGNVAHALPAGDGTISLLALNTEVQLATAEESTWKPLIEIFAGPGKVNFDRRKVLVTGFRFHRKGEKEGSAFHRVMRPQGVAIAILNMAAWVKVGTNNEIENIRISCGPAGPKPFRGYQTEEFLIGKSWDDPVYQGASDILASEVSLRTSAYRATKEYRHKLLPLLLKEVMQRAIKRANE
jgi:carbon-monoxide dehydrogenase medium subunit